MPKNQGQQTQSVPKVSDESVTGHVFKDNEINGEQTFSVEVGDPPSALDEIFLYLRVAIEGGSVAPLRKLIQGLIVDTEPQEAIVLRDQLMRLRALGEAVAQSAQEAYAAR